jgi:hypothetical protein
VNDDRTDNNATMLRLAVPQRLELLAPGVLDGLLARLSNALATAPAARSDIPAMDLIRALGQGVGLRQVSPDRVSYIIAVLDQILWENNAARYATWTPGPPLQRDSVTKDGAKPLWADDAAYVAYIARNVAAAPLNPPPRSDAWARWAIDQVWACAKEVAAEYSAQIEDGRKAIGPALTRGAGRGQALAIARERAPLLLDTDVQAIVDEEASWWARTRLGRGLHVEMAGA